MAEKSQSQQNVVNDVFNLILQKAPDFLNMINEFINDPDANRVLNQVIKYAESKPEVTNVYFDPDGHTVQVEMTIKVKEDVDVQSYAVAVATLVPKIMKLLDSVMIMVAEKK